MTKHTIETASALHPREAITFPDGYPARGTLIEGKYIDLTGGTWEGIVFVGCHLALYTSKHHTTLTDCDVRNCMLAGERWGEVLRRMREEKPGSVSGEVRNGVPVPDDVDTFN